MEKLSAKISVPAGISVSPAGDKEHFTVAVRIAAVHLDFLFFQRRNLQRFRVVPVPGWSASFCSTGV